MQSMSVKPAQLSGLASSLLSNSRGIGGALDHLDKEVGTLRAAWDGDAQRAYDIAQAKWTVSLNEMNTLLARVANSADQMAAQYAAQDRRSAGRFAH